MKLFLMSEKSSKALQVQQKKNFVSKHGTQFSIPIIIIIKKHKINKKKKIAFFKNKRLTMFDVGLNWKQNSILSNSTQWLFINNSYFGYGCNQMMVNVYNWQSSLCPKGVGVCTDHTLSKWSYSQNGISSFPYYNRIYYPTTVGKLFYLFFCSFFFPICLLPLVMNGITCSCKKKKKSECIRNHQYICIL
ncbi:hypothetical protein RFI_09235 [Reticulomyxa filosa]|uniref:Uncharacterized protein n=1 Tax=Reticulomyxa filosa TaxID=46433 RepID=X6NPR8_RETFI|nr:hypothetical protein RFI_09235 [Reticulomyxa filosa]|eukprot:ETO27893.1 hypothetical protein RFI_09235 [Reticulomyxa filosa]